MALRNIINLPDELLTKESKPVTAFDDRLWVLLDDMYQTLKENNGVGIAAVQVGVLRRAIVVDTGDGLIELINPEIIQKKGKQCELEGCLSYPGMWGYVERPAYVKVKSLNRRGEPQVHEGTELLAIVFCHEIDHLNGVMFNDLAIEMLDGEPTEEQLENRPSRKKRKD